MYITCKYEKTNRDTEQRFIWLDSDWDRYHTYYTRLGLDCHIVGLVRTVIVVVYLVVSLQFTSAL